MPRFLIVLRNLSVLTLNLVPLSPLQVNAQPLSKATENSSVALALFEWHDIQKLGYPYDDGTAVRNLSDLNDI